MIGIQRTLDRICSAKYNGILASKIFRIPTEVPHLIAYSAILPVIPRSKLCPEQSERFLRKLFHLCVKSIVGQLLRQQQLFIFQLLFFYYVELIL